MGWGIKTYFENQYSLADAFFFNNQALIWELQKEFPDQANINFTTYETSDIQRMAQKFKLTSRKLLGHLWDRDVVAFYGDPAWEARLPLTDPAWSFTFTHTGENVVIEITAQKDGTWGDRPLAIPFPQRLGGIRLVSCTPKTDVLVTDDFALIDLAGKTRKAGETIRLQFGAHPLDSKPTTKKRPTLAALYFAGKNRAALTQALEKSSGATRDDLTFLIANMPLRDLKNLAPDFLLENIQYAQKARAEAPWKTRITDELYREYILPYANLSETRDPWRKDFYTRFKPLVANISEPGEAAIKLNTTIYDLLNVHYHATKRPRPDQSPAESIQATYASCSGLSILLVDACRAVGIPARVAGVAQWTKGPGNHTWVEIWDGQWHCIGAAESKALDDVWFGTGAAQADASQPFKRIYAAKFSRDTLYFPMVWNPYAHYVPAVDVTARYKKQFKKP
jgi:transglutaminase-like putative cysteine protease